MAVAGKVAITLSTENGGAWSADVTYDRLVAVKHNNNLYISRKTVTNVEPPNDEFWFLALEGYSGEDVQALIDRMNAIISGTTQVGNAKTLDGHRAEYFAQKADLSNYLPLTGGTAKNQIAVEKIDTSEANLRAKNTAGSVDLLVASNGRKGLYDGTNGKWIVSSMADGTVSLDGTASGNLPTKSTSGGTVTSSGSNAPIILNQTTEITSTLINYQHKGVYSGGIGMESTEKKPVVNIPNKGLYDLLHTGNKPTGTYTGNGSATERTIATGGIGNVCYVTGNGLAIVYNGGAILVSNGTVTAVKANEAKFVNGVMTLATTNAILNVNGATLTYQVP